MSTKKPYLELEYYQEIPEQHKTNMRKVLKELIGHCPHCDYCNNYITEEKYTPIWDQHKKVYYPNDNNMCTKCHQDKSIKRKEKYQRKYIYESKYVTFFRRSYFKVYLPRMKNKKK